jgi:hypothetical protein
MPVDAPPFDSVQVATPRSRKHIETYVAQQEKSFLSV